MNKLLMLMSYFTGIHAITSDYVNWCSLHCGDDENTMCIYKPQKNSGYCNNIEKATDIVFRMNILHKHNEYRNSLANGEISSNGTVWPKASNMLQMSWDYDLERLARRWAEQCSIKPFHDQCRKSPAFEFVGQNKGLRSRPHLFPPAELSFADWARGIEKTTLDDLDKMSLMGGLDFTQIVWAESHKLGCAAIHSVSNAIKTSTVVCNYGPEGNAMGEKIYQRGDPCTGCPTSTSCRNGSAYPHLCAAKGDARFPEEIPDYIDSSSGRLKLFGMPLEESETLVTAIITFHFHIIFTK